MSSSLNKVTLIGHLGADPDIRQTQDGRQIVNMRLATTESWKDKGTGEKRDKTEWHSIVIFSEGLGKIAAQYLNKGSKVYIEGQLQTRKWQDKDGHDRYSTEIVLQNFGGTLILLDSRPTDERKPPSASEYSQQQYATASGGEKGYKPQATNFAADLDDDIPF